MEQPRRPTSPLRPISPLPSATHKCVTVAARIRPSGDAADPPAAAAAAESGCAAIESHGLLKCVEASDDTHAVFHDKETRMDHNFVLDRVFGPEATQTDVYDFVGPPALDAIMQGYNATCLAYGQTGSGKTFTMMGKDHSGTDPKWKGLIPRIMDELFNRIAFVSTDVNIKCSAYVSYVEIYLERVQDLLDVRKSNLEIRESRGTRGIHVAECTKLEVRSMSDVLAVMRRGNVDRVVSFTSMQLLSFGCRCALRLTTDGLHLRIIRDERTQLPQPRHF